MSEKPHILVVDDDKGIRRMLRRYLEAEGFQVSEAADGTALRAALKDAKIDLVLLDLVMPGEDGLSLARDIRRHSSVPIIILTGKGDLIDRVVGLEAGADDYLTKPFHLREVLARIRSVLRRTRAPAQPSEEDKPPSPGSGEILGFLGWELDLTRRELHPPSGDRVALTTGEFELLRVFARNANRVLTRDQLLDLVKGRGWSAFDRSIDTQVARLRRKIERDPGKPELIKTVRGAGYVFAAAVTAR